MKSIKSGVRRLAVLAPLALALALQLCPRRM